MINLWLKLRGGKVKEESWRKFCFCGGTCRKKMEITRGNLSDVWGLIEEKGGKNVVKNRGI